jgi:chromosome segregation ATPase
VGSEVGFGVGELNGRREARDERDEREGGGWGLSASPLPGGFVGLLQRLKHDLKAGLATLRHGTAQAAIRALEETELLRIRLEIRKLDQQLDELYRDVGERGVNLREGGESVERVLYDAEVGRLVKEIQELKDAREKLESEITEIRSDV